HLPGTWLPPLGAGRSGQEEELAPGAPALADLERGLPLVQGERRRDRDRERPVGGELPELRQRFHAIGAVLVERVADAEFRGGGEIGDGEHTLRVTRRDLDEVRQGPADRGGVQDEVNRAAGDLPYPLNHPVSVRGDLGAQVTQPLRVRLPGGG